MSDIQRRRGSLPARILSFYATNPTEELSYNDMAIKFDSDIGTIRNAVGRLVEDGIESVHVVRLKQRRIAQ